MLIKAIIVDDDLKSRELIQTFCEVYGENKIQILDLCNSVDKAIISIEKNKPDLVFLDIDMPEKNGFDLINHFTRINFEIVFVTGHANQFTKGIEISALNYLMKPINPLNIKAIIERFEDKILLSDSINRIDILKNNLKDDKKSIVFPNNDGFTVAEISEIRYCETSNGDGKCKIMLNNESITVSKSLSTLFLLLPNHTFLKVSASAVINKNFIKSFDSKKFVLMMKNEYQIKVSEKYYTKTSLMNALEN